MSGEPYPKDENLRLILSSVMDQDQWIGQRIKVSLGFVWSMAFLLTISTAWMTADFSGAFPRSDAPACYILSVDAPDFQENLNEFFSRDTKPCPPEESVDRGFDWQGFRNLVTVSSLILILISSLGLFHNLFLIRQYKDYLKDHRALLKKYNRL